MKAAMVFVVAVGLASPALAQQERAAAEALFQDGRRLASDGKHAEACEKFTASDKLDPSVGARVQLGRCNLAQGKTASAWLSYKDAENLANRNGDSARAQLARTEAAKIEPSLSYVVLQVTEPVADQKVEFGGAEKPAALFGQRFPVDPSTYKVTASAPGFEGFKATVVVAKPGLHEVKVPALVATTTEPKTPDVIEPGEPTDPTPNPLPTEPPIDQPIDESSGQTRKLVAYGVAGSGVALVATGLVVGQLARSAYNDRVEHCEFGNVCSPEGVDLVNKAKTRATIATVLTIGGAAAIAGGVALYLTAPKAKRAKAAVVPSIGPGFAGLAITGAL